MSSSIFLLCFFTHQLQLIAVTAFSQVIRQVREETKARVIVFNPIDGCDERIVMCRSMDEAPTLVCSAQEALGRYDGGSAVELKILGCTLCTTLKLDIIILVWVFVCKSMFHATVMS